MDFSQFQYACAISGGIGSGKSSACRILESMGYEIIDADKIAHKALEEQTSQIISIFGEEVLEGERISRAKLGKIVFKDSILRQKLNELLSARIQEKLYEECLRLEKRERWFFVEIALLFEQREIYNFLHSILIACSMDVQIERICQRNHLGCEEAKERILAQMPLEQKLKMADRVIWNEGGLDALRDQLKLFLSEIV